MKFSQFGDLFARESGIVTLMEDIGNALHDNPNAILMGGGNPGRIPAVESAIAAELAKLAQDGQRLHDTLGRYQAPQGDLEFRSEVANYLRRRCGWPVSAANIAVTSGSQTGFFLLFNLLGGKTADGAMRHVHLPLVPEYIGYSDVGLVPGLFRATRPAIDRLEKHLFKYRLDFDALALSPETAALCVSRPTNPSGNMITDAELERLAGIAHEHDIPLIIDGAYGLPFPGMVFTDASPFWDTNTILALSLSKLGLPGTRTGILVADEEMIDALARASTILSLACAGLGPALTRALFADDAITRLGSEQIRPFYEARAQLALTHLSTGLADDVPFAIHRPEGSMFLWLWLENLPGGSEALYRRLKQQGVIVVPGDSFFFGLEEDWPHRHECLRISYAQAPEVVARGLDIIATEVNRTYQHGG